MNNAAAISTFRKLGLSRREADVLLCIARGQSNTEIGLSLRMSPLTAKKHLEHIFKKLHVKTRLAAAVKVGEVCSFSASAFSPKPARRIRTVHATVAASSALQVNFAKTPETEPSTSLPK
jgi:DNA-binding CsgD family transcriptional regulator